MKDKLNKILGRTKNNNLISIISPRKDLPIELLKQILKDGKNCVFVSTNTRATIIEKELNKLLNDDIDSRIRIIDCSGRKESFNTYTSDLSSLTHLNVVLAQSLSDLMSPEPRICIVDCFSDIEKSNRPEDVFKFVEILTEIGKRYKTKTLLFSDKSRSLKNLVNRVKMMK